MIFIWQRASFSHALIPASRVIQATSGFLTTAPDKPTRSPVALYRYLEALPALIQCLLALSARARSNPRHMSQKEYADRRHVSTTPSAIAGQAARTQHALGTLAAAFSWGSGSRCLDVRLYCLLFSCPGRRASYTACSGHVKRLNRPEAQVLFNLTYRRSASFDYYPRPPRRVSVIPQTPKAWLLIDCARLRRRLRLAEGPRCLVEGLAVLLRSKRSGQ